MTLKRFFEKLREVYEEWKLDDEGAIRTVREFEFTDFRFPFSLEEIEKMKAPLLQALFGTSDSKVAAERNRKPLRESIDPIAAVCKKMTGKLFRATEEVGLRAAKEIGLPANVAIEVVYATDNEEWQGSNIRNDLLEACNLGRTAKDC